MAFRDHERAPVNGYRDFFVDLRPHPAGAPVAAPWQASWQAIFHASLALQNVSSEPPYHVRVTKNRQGGKKLHPAIIDLLNDLPTVSLSFNNDIIVPTDADLVMMAMLTSWKD